MNFEEQRLSRRKMLALVSAPTMAAAALGTVPAGVLAQGAQPDSQPSASSAREGRDLGTRVYNVRDYNAKGDGATLDTAAIQAAIEACAADHGGTVLVPAGVFLIGPIALKSNVTLHVAAGARLLATADASQYHPAPGIPLQGDHTMGDGNAGLITGAEAENVTIEGMGTIDGQGAAVRAGGLGGNRRPHLVLFYRCTNLKIRDIYMFHSAFHTCRICNSSHVQIDGIRINSRVAGNNDGFHFVSAEHVNISNVNIRCQDDACALFGSCRFIMVTNCSFSTRWSVFRFGGGIAENITVSNCLFRQVYGCPIKLRCQPGSRYENMSYSNLVFQDVSGPICLQAGPQRESDERKTGAIMRNISFSNISGNVVTEESRLDDSDSIGLNRPGERRSCIILNCVEGNTMENISLSDIRLTFGGGGTAENATRRELPNIAAEYFSLGEMPAYGLYARNARGVTLNNLRFQVATPELRPALILDKVQDASIFGLAAEGNPEAESLLRLINTSETLIASPRVLTAASVFLRVEGSDSRAITVDGGDLSKAAEPLAFADGASQSAVRLRT